MAPGPGSILAGYRLLAWLFPARDISELTSESYEELCEKYRSRDFWGNWLGCLCYCLLVVVYFLLLLAIGNWITSGVPRERFIGPFEFLYFFAAGFLSLFSAGFFMFLMLRLVLGKQEYDTYLAYGGEKIRRSGLRVRIHFGKAFGLFFWVFVPPLMLAMLAYMDTYASFTEQNIILNPYWTLGQQIVRPYQDVRGIYEIKKVHRRNHDEIEPFQVIVFTDGTRWETDRGSLDPKLQMQRDVMTFVAGKSGKPVKPVEFEEDIPAR
ncbi:MAG: hypothetical protein JWM11_5549 [Planctomycetaceae bacterium]|nr:hypothetical protein [Planctomycetaceae bacterium]